MGAAFDALGSLVAGVDLEGADERDEALPRQRYRSIFISDLHLGTPGCQAGPLLDFLKSHPSDHLYLVGDIIDGWQLRKRWYWPQSHNDVIQKLLRRARKGCRVVFVPTPSVVDMLRRRGFRNLREWTHGVDTQLFQFRPEPGTFPGLEGAARPLALFVGRVSYEKNIETFLRMDFPGTKVVCGVGPLEAELKKRHPHVRWVGLLPRNELAKLYAAADLFVFPSRADTFGLVMAEAMACGTPVAAYPADGPLTVLARPGHEGSGSLGGAMHEDLQQACFAALSVPRVHARERAMDFSWDQAAALFERFLVPAHPGPARNGPAAVTLLS